MKDVLGDAIGRFDSVDWFDLTHYSYVMATYTTITSKGQITIPAEARRALNLRPGQKVSVRVEGERLVIDAPRDIEWLRAKIREEGVPLDRPPVSGDGWAARMEDYRG